MPFFRQDAHEPLRILDNSHNVYAMPAPVHGTSLSDGLGPPGGGVRLRQSSRGARPAKNSIDRATLAATKRSRRGESSSRATACRGSIEPLRAASMEAARLVFIPWA